MITFNLSLYPGMAWSITNMFYLSVGQKITEISKICLPIN